MARGMLLFGLFLNGVMGLFLSDLSGQFTYTNASFPGIGDTLRTVLVSDLSFLDIGDAGENKTWDFTAVQGGRRLELVGRPASDGLASDQFPNANLLYIEEGNLERYLQTTAETFSDVGFFGSAAVEGLFEAQGYYTEPNVLQRAPLTYGDDYTAETALVIPAAYDDLPDSITSAFPAFDSMRIVSTIEQQGEVDAYGLLDIPGGSYEVLRDHRREITDTKLEIKVGIFPWVDVTATGQNVLPGIFGRDTVHNMFFLAEGVKEPIALLSIDTDGSIMGGALKDEGLITSTTDITDASRPEFYAYPNPVFLDLNISYRHMEPGTYTLRIFNLLGEDVFEEPRLLKKEGDLLVDVSNLRRGAYFYSLLAEDGSSLGTKRLVVIRP